MATPFPRVPRPIAQQLLAEFAPRAPRPGTLHFCANARGRSGSFPGRGDIKDHPHKPPSHEGILEKFQPDTRSASPISLPPHDLMEPCYNAYQPAEQLALFLNPTLYLPNLAPSLRELRSDLAHIRKALEHPEPAAEAYYWTDEVDESSIAHFRGRHMILEETVFWSEIAMLRRRDIFQVQTRVRAIERWLDNVERDCAAARLTPALVAPPSAEFPGGRVLFARFPGPPFRFQDPLPSWDAEDFFVQDESDEEEDRYEWMNLPRDERLFRLMMRKEMRGSSPGFVNEINRYPEGQVGLWTGVQYGFGPWNSGF